MTQTLAVRRYVPPVAGFAMAARSARLARIATPSRRAAPTLMMSGEMLRGRYVVVGWAGGQSRSAMKSVVGTPPSTNAKGSSSSRASEKSGGRPWRPSGNEAVCDGSTRSAHSRRYPRTSGAARTSSGTLVGLLRSCRKRASTASAYCSCFDHAPQQSVGGRAPRAKGRSGRAPRVAFTAIAAAPWCMNVPVWARAAATRSYSGLPASAACERQASPAHGLASALSSSQAAPRSGQETTRASGSSHARKQTGGSRKADVTKESAAGTADERASLRLLRRSSSGSETRSAPTSASGGPFVGVRKNTM